MANKFSVPVGRGYGHLLTDMGDRMVQSGERRDEKEGQKIKQEYLAEMKSEASKAYNSGDIDAMINVSLAYPEISGSMSAAMQHKSERTEQNYQDVLFDFYVDPTEQNASDIITARQTMLGEEGADSAETDGFLDKVRTDPVKAQKEIEKELAFRYPDKMKKLMEATGKTATGTASQQEYKQAVDQGYKGSLLEFKKEVSARSSSTKQKTSPILVRDKEGNVSIAAGVFDTATGKLNTEVTPLTGYEFVSKLGETAGEKRGAEVVQAGEKAAATGEESRATALISRGIAAAESTAQLRRAIDLLDTVKTGGIDSLKYQAKRLFGIEGADEGELSNSLGVAVLSQLRETFGAAFTENEGKRLERIQASFSKSPESNRRLLTQALRIATTTAKRARKAALARKDQDTVDDIDDLLSFSLSMDPGKAKPEETQNLTPEEHNELPVGSIYMHDGIEYIKGNK